MQNFKKQATVALILQALQFFTSAHSDLDQIISGRELCFVVNYNPAAWVEIVSDLNSTNLLLEYHDFLSKRLINKNHYTTFLIHQTGVGMSDNSYNTILSQRWKSNIWRFSHSVIISSGNLDLISKLLWLYGPNVSESDTIFARISATEFTAQHVSKMFQRDICFGKMYPTLILMIHDWIQNSDNATKIQLVCPLCQNALRPEEMRLGTDDNATQIYSSLEIANIQYNLKHGHGSKALICQVGFRGYVGPFEYHKTIEDNARRNYDVRNDKDAVILGILVNYFNFTYEQENWAALEGNYSGIYLSPGGDMPAHHIYGRHLSISYIISEFLLYCRKKPIIEQTGWDFFYSPFDLITWSVILLTGIVFAVYHKGKMSYGLDVFLGVLGLPYTSNWNQSRFLAYFLVVLLNLNVGYLSVIMSKIIIPNRELDVQTPAELFKQGYRFIDQNVSSNAAGFLRYWGPSLKASKINFTKISDVLAEDPSCSSTHHPKCISDLAGLATGANYEFKKTEVLLSISAAIRDLCHGVKQPLRSYWVSFYFQGPLSTKLHKTYTFLTSTGIDVFWDKLYKAGSYYYAYRRANHTSKEANDPSPLSFQTPILVCFKAYGVLIGVCISVLLIEQVYHYLNKPTKLFKRFKHSKPVTPMIGDSTNPSSPTSELSLTRCPE